LNSTGLCTKAFQAGSQAKILEPWKALDNIPADHPLSTLNTNRGRLK